jgi:hypothetical protein
MPASVKAKIKDAGGFWAALISVLPALAAAGRIVRRSTSTGIIRTDTGEALPGSNGMHIFVQVQDGADVERFLRLLHDLCWLAGFGWHMVGAGGQLLDRSIVDRMVSAPERLVFEAAPIMVALLVQDLSSRLPQVHDGAAIYTKEACPPLRIIETAQLRQLKAKSAHALAPDRSKERERFISERAKPLAAKAGITEQEARRVIERQCDGILLPDVALPWDDEEFAGCAVSDVMADPARFVGATLADPLEGPDYGRAKAMVMRRADGSPWINSFAHGHTVYHLLFDPRAATAAVEAAPPDRASDVFVRVAVNADLDADQMETLRNRVAGLAGVGKRAVDAKLKAAKRTGKSNPTGSPRPSGRRTAGSTADDPGSEFGCTLAPADGGFERRVGCLADAGTAYARHRGRRYAGPSAPSPDHACVVGSWRKRGRNGRYAPPGARASASDALRRGRAGGDDRAAY